MVVAFHAGLPLPGGFLGVDVFFVISGYVITAMLHREFARSGKIQLRQFYRRRFRRLAPALALVTTVTCVASIFVLSPFGPQQMASKTAIGATLFVANFVIASTTGNYFDAPAELNPLLNTWSLSVEEQFYFVFPFVLLLAWRLSGRLRAGRGIPLALIAAVAAVSIALACTSNFGIEPGAAKDFLGFYSPVVRAWEFALGSLLLLSTLAAKPRSRAFGASLGGAGAILLGASLWLINPSTPTHLGLGPCSQS